VSALERALLNDLAGREGCNLSELLRRMVWTLMDRLDAEEKARRRRAGAGTNGSGGQI
jgi:hypothetical protein